MQPQQFRGNVCRIGRASDTLASIYGSHPTIGELPFMAARCLFANPVTSVENSFKDRALNMVCAQALQVQHYIFDV